MPRRRYRRRRYRRRGMKRKRITLRKTARQVRMLKAAVERKAYITTRTSAGSYVTASTTPNIVNVFGPAQGDSAQEIIGRKCQVKSLVLRLLLKSASSEPAFVRVVCFRQKWNQEIDAPVAGDIYHAQSTATTAINWPLQPKFQVIGKNYQTLYDEIITIGAFSNTPDQRFGSGETCKARVVRIPINKPYSAVAGVGGYQGRLYVMLGIHDSAGVVSYAYTTTVYYVDM